VLEQFGDGSFVEEKVGVDVVGGKEVGEEKAGGSSADDDGIVDYCFFVGGGGGGVDLITPRPSFRRRSG